MAVGKMGSVERDSSHHVYSAIDLADLTLWSKVVQKETIVEAFKHVSGNLSIYLFSLSLSLSLSLSALLWHLSKGHFITTVCPL